VFSLKTLTFSLTCLSWHWRRLP